MPSIPGAVFPVIDCIALSVSPSSSSPVHPLCTLSAPVIYSQFYVFFVCQLYVFVILFLFSVVFLFYFFAYLHVSCSLSYFFIFYFMFTCSTSLCLSPLCIYLLFPIFVSYTYTTVHSGSNHKCASSCPEIVSHLPYMHSTCP